MTRVMESLRASIRRALDERGTNASSVARVAGLPQRALYNVLHGHVPSLDRAGEICDALGLELYIGRQRPAHVLDADRLQLALEAAEEGLTATGRVMNARQKARLVLAIYDLVEDSADAETGARVIRLIQATG